MKGRVGTGVGFLWLLPWCLIAPGAAEARGNAQVIAGARDPMAPVHTRRIEERLTTAYDTIRQESPTAQQIRDQMGRSRRGAQPHITYYAGHGAADTNPRGALIGQDHRPVTAADLAREMGCGEGIHILILDSCFSGEVAKQAARASCTVITSTPPEGTEQEKACPVRGADSFSGRVTDALSGSADADGDAKVTVKELADYLAREWDEVGARRHFSNYADKGTGDVVLATYMRYEVTEVTGDVEIFDPAVPDEEGPPVRVGQEWTDCTWIRVAEGGQVKLKRKLGCSNRITQGPGELHLTAPRPNPGGTMYELASGTVTIEEAPFCEPIEHCGVATVGVEVEPADSGRAEGEVTRYTVTLDPATGATRVESSASSPVPLRAVPRLGPRAGQAVTVFPGDALTFPYVPSIGGGVEGEVAPPGSRLIVPSAVLAGEVATVSAVDAVGQTLRGVVVEAVGDAYVTDDRGRISLRVAEGVEALVLTLGGEDGGTPARTPVVDRPADFDPKGPPHLSGTRRYTSLDTPLTLQGGPFDGLAEDNVVRLGEVPLPVLASSPVSLVVDPPDGLAPGTYPLQVTTGSGDSETVSLTFVRIRLEATATRLVRGQKASARVIVEGTEEPVLLRITNLVPETIRIQGGDVQTLRTQGGTDNAVSLKFVARRVGGFEIEAEILEEDDR